MIDAAKGLAMTVADLVADPEQWQKPKMNFNHK